MRASVMPRSSRMSASSSTTSIWLLLMSLQPSRRLAQHREASALRGLDVFEPRVVRLAHLARDVETESRAAGRRSEKRLEELAAQRRRHTRPVVDHVQFYRSLSRIEVDDDTDARLAAPAVPR